MNENSEEKSRPGALRSRRVAAVVLLVVAGAALAGPHLPVNWRDSVLLLMGAAFIVWSALVRSRGLLVPGGVLIGVGVGTLLRPGYGNGAFLLSMAGGFLLIALLTPLLFGREPRCRWPFWPAAALGLAGLLQVAGPEAQQGFRAVQPFWPYLLIAVALFLLFSKPQRQG